MNTFNITRSSSGSNDYLCFGVVMSINDVLRCLQPVEGDRRAVILLVAVTDAANGTGTHCSGNRSASSSAH